MKDTEYGHGRQRGVSLLLPIIIVFVIFGSIVFGVSQKISREMSASAIQNLSESLNLIQTRLPS